MSHFFSMLSLIKGENWTLPDADSVLLRQVSKISVINHFLAAPFSLHWLWRSLQ